MGRCRKFMKEYQRMCATIQRDNRNSGYGPCMNCPVIRTCFMDPGFATIEDSDIAAIERAVRRWSEKHPLQEGDTG